MEAFLEIRDRLCREDRGTTPTEMPVTDFGMLYRLPYVDPDGVRLEVNLFKDETTLKELHERGVETRPFHGAVAGV